MNILLSIPVELSASPVATLSPAFQEVGKGGVTGLAVLSFLFVIFIFLLCVGMVVLWIWSLINLLSSTVKTSTEKLLWFLVVICLPFLGPILYIFLGVDKKVRSKK
jgi:hypothetical protein